MKKHFIQFSGLLVAVVLLAGIVHAYVPPEGLNSNTDAPLNVTSTDQVKGGGLTVGTFQAQKNAFFQQNVYLDGSTRGGTPSTSANAPVKFGDATHKVDTLFTGALAVTGSYQSDTLKTGGGQKPVCVDDKGVLYLCGGSSGGTGGDGYVLLSLSFTPDGSGLVAKLSSSIEKDVTVYVAGKRGSGSTSSPFVSFLKSFYTAEAVVTPGVCSLGTSYTAMQTMFVYSGTVTSNQVGLPAGCNSTNIDVMISSYSPTTSIKGPIVTSNPN